MDEPSPPGADEELMDVETRFMIVSFGRRYASNKFLFTSRAKSWRRCGRLSSSAGVVKVLCEAEYEAHRER